MVEANETAVNLQTGPIYLARVLRALRDRHVVNRYGSEVYALLVTILTTQDEFKHRRPIDYHNEQLMLAAGIRSLSSLKRVRAKAIESGWLLYSAGAKNRPPTYLVQIPMDALDAPDNETPAAQRSTPTPNTGPEMVRNSLNTGPNLDQKREDSGSKMNQNPARCPALSPHSGSEMTLNAAHLHTRSRSSHLRCDSTPELEAEFFEKWNKLPGVHKATKTEGKRLNQLRTRLRDPDWNWRGAMAKFPLPCTQGEPGGWEPDVDWFLKPDSVMHILEGKYDWRKRGTKVLPQVVDGVEQKYQDAKGDF
jgi:hypothetical protein